MVKKILHIGAVLFFFSILQIYAETNQQNATSKTVKLLVSGEGTTKEEATRAALRSAIEQAFGTFVSSNTDVLNDDIVKDEIATVSSGNIQSYKELSTVDFDETKVVNIEAVVSIGKLVSFAKSKGMKTELAGATFAMNMKMRELNKKNELIALENLYKQLMILGKDTHLFDYELITSEPYQAEYGMYGVDVTIKLIPNKNAITFYDIYEKTLKSLALSPKEVIELKKARTEVFPYDNLGFRAYDYKDCYGYYVADNQLDDVFLRNDLKSNRYGDRCFTRLFDVLYLNSIFRFKIVDNLNNVFVVAEKSDKRNIDAYERNSIAIAAEYEVKNIGEHKTIVNYYLPYNLNNGKYYKPKERQKLYDYTDDFARTVEDIRSIKTLNKSFTICLTYSPEEFMSLSSLEIKPVSELSIIK